jgi:hypothetical protein
MTDILDRIDDLTGLVCGWCQQALSSDGPSRYFCDEQHQERWSRTGAECPPDMMPGVLTISVDTADYRERMTAVAASMAELARSCDAARIATTLVVEDWLLDYGRATAPPVPLPADRMARALELRRTRNTGPAQRQRVPRRIDPRWHR